jgi:hypothetical protein
VASHPGKHPRYFEQEQKAANGEAGGSALSTLEGFARFRSKGSPPVERKVNIRVAGSVAKIYLDLCDAAWRAVEIDAAGWRVIEYPADHGVYFRRARGMRALPAPVHEGSLKTLKKFINFTSNDDFILLVAWLIGALPIRRVHIRSWGSMVNMEARNPQPHFPDLSRRNCDYRLGSVLKAEGHLLQLVRGFE